MKFHLNSNVCLNQTQYITLYFQNMPDYFVSNNDI